MNDRSLSDEGVEPVGLVGEPEPNGYQEVGYVDTSSQFVIGAGAAFVVSGPGAGGDLTGYTFAGRTTTETVIQYTEDQQAELDARYAALRRGLQGGVVRSAVSSEESKLFLTAVTARLEPCPVCRAALVVVSGRIFGPHRLWSDGGIIAVTPHHTEGCAGRLSIPADAVELPEGATVVDVAVGPAPVPRPQCPETHPKDGRQCTRIEHPASIVGPVSARRHRANPAVGQRTDTDRWETPQGGPG